MQNTDKVMDVGKFSGADVEKTAELPQLQLVEALDKVVDMPVVCNDRCRGGAVHQGCGRPCDHA